MGCAFAKVAVEHRGQHFPTSGGRCILGTNLLLDVSQVDKSAHRCYTEYSDLDASSRNSIFARDFTFPQLDPGTQRSYLL